MHRAPGQLGRVDQTAGESHSLPVPGMLRERSTRPCSREALIE